MENTRTVHIIFGPVAAGKSTYAQKLSTQKNAVRFAIDEWMHSLFGEDKPQKMDMTWAMSRVQRCQTTIWLTAKRILASGRDVVLELGTMREADRDRVNALVASAGHTAIFHFLDAPREVREQRVRQRNIEKGGSYSFEVTPAMFNAMEMYFEPPTEKELSRSIIVRGEMHHG